MLGVDVSPPTTSAFSSVKFRSDDFQFAAIRLYPPGNADILISIRLLGRSELGAIVSSALAWAQPTPRIVSWKVPAPEAAQRVAVMPWVSVRASI